MQMQSHAFPKEKCPHYNTAEYRLISRRHNSTPLLRETLSCVLRLGHLRFNQADNSHHDSAAPPPPTVEEWKICLGRNLSRPRQRMRRRSTSPCSIAAHQSPANKVPTHSPTHKMP